MKVNRKLWLACLPVFLLSSVILLSATSRAQGPDPIPAGCTKTYSSSLGYYCDAGTCIPSNWKSCHQHGQGVNLWCECTSP